VTADSGFSAKDKRIVLIACCIAAFIAPLAASMINVAIPTIGDEFGVSAHDRGLLVLTYFLSSVAFLVPMSRFSDLYGKRKIFLCGLVIVLFSSLMSAFSASFFILMGWRLLTGLGTACIATTSISMIAQVYPRAHRGLPLALNTMCIYVGATMGPALGGFVTEVLGWEWIFLAIVPFAVVGFIAMSYFKHEFVTSKGEPFDHKGALLYGVGIIALMYGISNLPGMHAAMFVAAGIATLVIFFKFETKERYPVLTVGLFRGRTFRRSCIAAFLNYGAAFAIVFTLSMYLQQICGLSPGEAGLIILIQPAVQSVVTPFAGRMSDRIDPRILTTSGMISMCISTAVMITLTADLQMFKIFTVLMFSGLGYALFSTANTNVIMGSVSEKNYSDSSGLVSVMRQVGMMSSLAIVMCMISVFMGTTSNIEPAMFGAFIDVIRYSFAVCFCLAFVGVFMTWFSKDMTDNAKNEDA